MLKAVNNNEVRGGRTKGGGGMVVVRSGAVLPIQALGDSISQTQALNFLKGMFVKTIL